MNIAFIVLMTFLLAFPVSGDLQLCQHHSGQVHIFSGKTCDGEHSHAVFSHHDQHRHDHGERHSDHSSPREHHEPCTHDTISNGDDYSAQFFQLHLSPILTAQFAPTEAFDIAEGALEYGYKKTLYASRGPPGDGGPQGYFHATIRLLI